MAASYRISTDGGLAGVLQWIVKWYGETSDLQVEQFCINASKTVCESRLDYIALQHLTCRNDSDLHAFLKFAALRWLECNSKEPKTIAWEVLYYSPDEERCKGRKVISPTGEQFDITSPQVLYDNDEDFPLSYGDAIRIDLHAFDISVEVGGTAPFNLLTPLLDGMVEKAIWVPYPKGVTTQSFQKSKHDLGAVAAYSIELRRV